MHTTADASTELFAPTPSAVPTATTSNTTNKNNDIIEFHALNFMDLEETQAFMTSFFQRHPECDKGFSFVSLFSITMWIHLNHGDVGLRAFLDHSMRLVDAR
jgi:hypothetical protein